VWPAMKERVKSRIVDLVAALTIAAFVAWIWPAEAGQIAKIAAGGGALVLLTCARGVGLSHIAMWRKERVRATAAEVARDESKAALHKAQKVVTPVDLLNDLRSRLDRLIDLGKANGAWANMAIAHNYVEAIIACLQGGLTSKAFRDAKSALEHTIGPGRDKLAFDEYGMPVFFPQLVVIPAREWLELFRERVNEQMIRVAITPDDKP